MSLWDENRKILYNKNAELAKRVEKAKASEELLFTLSRSGVPTAQLHLFQKGARRFYFLHSSVDPLYEAQKICETYQADYLFVIGLGAAHHVRNFLSRSSLKRLVLIEPRVDYLKKSLEELSLGDLLEDERLLLICPDDEFKLSEILQQDYQAFFHPYVEVMHLTRRKLENPPFFQKISECITQLINSAQDDVRVMKFFGKRWTYNSIRNLCSLHNSLLPPTVFPHNVLLLASGPSLEDHVKYIQKKKPFICAVDSALPFLQEHAITPQMIVTIDCQVYGYIHVRRGGEFLHFCDITAHPPRSSKTAVFFMGPHPLSLLLQKKGLLPPTISTYGGNVTTSAYRLLQSLGIKEIEVIGADFNYPNGKSHARGSYPFSYHDIRQNRSFPSETYHSLSFLKEETSYKRDESRVVYQTQKMRRYAEQFSYLRVHREQEWKYSDYRRKARSFLLNYKKDMERLSKTLDHTEKKNDLVLSLIPTATWIAAHNPSLYEKDPLLCIEQAIRMTSHYICLFI